MFTTSCYNHDGIDERMEEKTNVLNTTATKFRKKTRGNVTPFRYGSFEEENDLDVNDTNRIPNKRQRELDENEIWTKLQRGGKRFARAVDIENRVFEDRIGISITSSEELPNQFSMFNLLKSQNIQNVVHVDYINPYKVLIQLSDESSAEILLNCKVFKQKGFKCQKT